MRKVLLALFIASPVFLLAQQKTTVRGITFHLIGSSTAETLDGKYKAIDYLTSSFPTNWESEYDNSYLQLGSTFQNAWRIGIDLSLGSKAAEPRFEKQLEFGASYVNRFGFIFSQSKDSMIGSVSYPTPLGTLHQDTTFRRGRSLENSTKMGTIDCQIRIYTNREHWLKAYAGAKVLAGFTFNSIISASTSENTRIFTYLDDSQIYRPSGDYYYYDPQTTYKKGPDYMEFRASIPVGLEARIGHLDSSAGQFVLFFEGQVGLELTTGILGSLTTSTGLGLGLRYHL